MCVPIIWCSVCFHDVFLRLKQSENHQIKLSKPLTILQMKCSIKISYFISCLHIVLQRKLKCVLVNVKEIKALWYSYIFHCTVNLLGLVHQ